MDTSSLNEYPDVLTVAELKDYLRIGRRQAYERCHQDNFPSAKIGGSIRIPKKSLQEWLQSQMDNDTYENPFLQVA